MSTPTSSRPPRPDMKSRTPYDDPFGNFSVPTTFDAVAIEIDEAIDPLPDGDDLILMARKSSPESTGFRPWTSQSREPEQFEHRAHRHFDADVTNTGSTVNDETTETILVTSDTSGTVGTAAGDAPAVGSVSTTVNFGERIRDRVHRPPLVDRRERHLETFVTPFGDFAIPTTLMQRRSARRYDRSVLRLPSELSQPDAAACS